MAIEEEKSLITLELDTSNEKYNALEHIENDLQPSVVRYEIVPAIADIDARIEEINAQVSELNIDIDRLTNHADTIDYVVAVASGVLTGLIDSFFVGETEINKEKVQELLEKKYHTANDSGYKHKNSDGNWTSSAMYHRLDDLAHHPTVSGLIASILVRYFSLVVFIDGSDGKPHVFFADTSSPEVTKQEIGDLIKAWIGATIGGVCIWLSNVAIQKYEEVNNEEMPEPLKKIIRVVGASPLILEVLKTVDVWVGHMMSDVSTSQGIPGIFLSLLKEISVLPIIRNTDFRVWVDGLYRKGNMNLSEWGGVAFTAAKKQSLPILINEALVRIFYFVRRLAEELKAKKEFKCVDWNNVIPFNNRTVERMMTISTGTFTAVDLADAVIRGAINSGGNWAGFAKNFILRVNFVGIGRFAIAIGVDVGMGIKKSKKEKERIVLNNEKLHLLNAKLFYKEEKVWEAAKDAQTSVNELFDAIETVTPDIVKTLGNMEESIVGIADLELNEDTRNLLADLLDIDEE